MDLQIDVDAARAQHALHLLGDFATAAGVNEQMLAMRRPTSFTLRSTRIAPRYGSRGLRQ